MKNKKMLGLTVAGISAGAINGLFGAGGGMILVPLLTLMTDLDDEEIFPTSVSIILPVCLVSLSITFDPTIIPWRQTVLYLVGSAVGGITAGFFGKNIPTIWLHRLLGILILWGGIRYLC